MNLFIRLQMDAITKLFARWLIPGSCPIFCDFVAGWKFWACYQHILHVNSETKKKSEAVFPYAAVFFLIYKVFVAMKLSRWRALSFINPWEKAELCLWKLLLWPTCALVRKSAPDLLILLVYLVAHLLSPKWKMTSSLRVVFSQLSEHRIKQLFVLISFTL